MGFPVFSLRKAHKSYRAFVVHNPETAKAALREGRNAAVCQNQASLPSPWGSSTRRMNQLSSQCTVTVPPYFSAAARTVRTP